LTGFHLPNAVARFTATPEMTDSQQHSGDISENNLSGRKVCSTEERETVCVALLVWTGV